MPKDVTEIRWHARGGQGAKTAATLVALVALEEGKHSQGFPEYGPERMGAPIRGFTRISSNEIRLHCPIEHPDVVVILDETLIGTAPTTDGATPDTLFLVNSSGDPAAMRKKLGLKDGKVYCVDATKISLDEIGRDIPNTPMIGALIRITNCISMDAMKTDIEHKFLKKFGERIVQGNVRAVQRAYEEVKSE